MKRPQIQRKTRDTILIITNGKETEKNYFENITSKYRTEFKIKVKYKNAECDGLVQYACGFNQTEYNQIWCVFDIDESFVEGHLVNALKMARDNNINIAYSNEDFELWLLYHFTAIVIPTLGRKRYVREINERLKPIGCKYQKSDLELIREIFIPKIPEALHNAKAYCQKLEAEHQKEYGNDKFPIWKWKSSTTVYKLIEAMKLEEKDN